MFAREPSTARAPTIALCHEWLAAPRGSEKTFEAMAASLPDAELYALTCSRSAGVSFGGRGVTTTFLDRMTPLRNRRSLQLPLMPLAWRYASRRTYDLVVTSSHACAKGFWPARNALHLCYCYTPMRYVWLSAVDARGGRSRLRRPVESYLRSWDLTATRWVDDFAAISVAVQDRIEEFYGRSARVIHPPVDVDFFTPAPEKPNGGFALAVSRLVGYKRLDAALLACHRLDVPLVIAGCGPEEQRLRALAAKLGAAVRFVSAPNGDELRGLYRGADVLVFPAEEDFGIVAVEAQACGTPVVAFAKGGSMDTVVPGKTGVLVETQDADCLAEGIRVALDARFDADDCRRNAERFAVSRFQRQFLDWVEGAAAGLGTGTVRTRVPV